MSCWLRHVTTFSLSLNVIIVPSWLVLILPRLLYPLYISPLSFAVSLSSLSSLLSFLILSISCSFSNVSPLSFPALFFFFSFALPSHSFCPYLIFPFRLFSVFSLPLRSFFLFHSFSPFSFFFSV